MSVQASSRSVDVPTYDLGPGRSGDELMLNLVIYTAVAGLVLALLWIVFLFISGAREARRDTRR